MRRQRPASPLVSKHNVGNGQDVSSRQHPESCRKQNGRIALGNPPILRLVFSPIDYGWNGSPSCWIVMSMIPAVRIGAEFSPVTLGPTGIAARASSTSSPSVM